MTGPSQGRQAWEMPPSAEGHTKMSTTSPFKTNEVRGHLNWCTLGYQNPNFFWYHYCHQRHIQEMLTKCKFSLPMRSKLEHIDADCVLKKSKGTWCTLNDYQGSPLGCEHGSFMACFTSRLLFGKTFAVLERGPEYWVLLECKPGTTIGPLLHPGFLFCHEDGGYLPHKRVRYDLILTKPTSLYGATIRSVPHHNCRSNGCRELDQEVNRQWLIDYVRCEVKRVPRSRTSMFERAFPEAFAV